MYLGFRLRDENHFHPSTDGKRLFSSFFSSLYYIMSSKSRSNNNSSSGCCRRILGCGCTLLICGTLSVLLWHFLGRPSSPEEALDKIRDISLDDFNNVLRNITLDDWLRGFNNDPYVGDNTTFAWESDGTGLKLELQNALDEEWHEIFEAAVQDWQESDALSLSTRKVEVDRECKAVEGVMKVCNANYGATGWLGVYWPV